MTIRVTGGSARQHGSCNFCNRHNDERGLNSGAVHVITSEDPHCTLEVRMCTDCIFELVAQINPRRKRK